MVADSGLVIISVIAVPDRKGGGYFYTNENIGLIYHLALFAACPTCRLCYDSPDLLSATRQRASQHGTFLVRSSSELWRRTPYNHSRWQLPRRDERQPQERPLQKLAERQPLWGSQATLIGGGGRLIGSVPLWRHRNPDAA
jgi:hypothetical protein